MHFFLLLKNIVFFFNISNRTAKNRIAIGQKTDPRQCASVPIMKKPISIGSIINLEKNRPYRPRTPLLLGGVTWSRGWWLYITSQLKILWVVFWIVLNGVQNPPNKLYFFILFSFFPFLFFLNNHHSQLYIIFLHSSFQLCWGVILNNKIWKYNFFCDFSFMWSIIFQEVL